MKPQRRFAPKGGEFAPESVARFIGIRNSKIISILRDSEDKEILVLLSH